jgi:Caspase domain
MKSLFSFVIFLVFLVDFSHAGLAQGVPCPDLRMTRTLFAPSDADLASAIKAEAGPGARPAEWAEVKACYEKFGLPYFHKLGVVKADPQNKANPTGSQVLVLVNGKRYFNPPSRAYFAAFHEGTLPPNWLVHDQVGGNQISLGSFSYLLPAFYVPEEIAGRAPVPIPQVSTGSPSPVARPAASIPTPVAPSNGFRRRAALVIGNGKYQFAAPLPNPPNDAADIAQALRKLGFDVVEGRDLDRPGMDNAIRQFGRKLDGADIALFFYAGHGLQVNGKNYLVPVDAKLERPGDLALDAVDIGNVLAQMEAEKRVNLIFLDACRDNPLARSLARSLGTRSSAVGQGLASIQSAIGTMIAYATQPDNVALDGEGRNSPFTAALLKHIVTPGLEIGTLMKRVRADVIAATREKQVPWDHSSLIGDVILVGPAAVIAPAQAVAVHAASVKDIFQKYNLIGTFAQDCSKPPTVQTPTDGRPQNWWFVNRLIDDNHAERSFMNSPTERGFVIIIDGASELQANQIRITGLRDGTISVDNVWHVDKNRTLTWQGIGDTKGDIANGKYTRTGNAVPWLTRCGASPP